MFRETARLLGEACGRIVGLPLGVIMATLDISAEAVMAAVEAGCETEEDIREFVKGTDWDES